MEKINLVSFHGLYSEGDNLEDLVGRLKVEAELNDIDVVSSQHDYPKLNATMGFRRWARDVVRDYILKCLSLEYHKYPDRKLYVFCHSNATWGISRAIGKYYNKVYWDSDMMHIDRLFLFGSTIKRNYDWGRYPLKVTNFVGTRDRVVWFSMFYKMGWSGRKGFKKVPNNLNEVWNDWKHSDFVLQKNFETIRHEVLERE